MEKLLKLSNLTFIKLHSYSINQRRQVSRPISCIEEIGRVMVTKVFPFNDFCRLKPIAQFLLERFVVAGHELYVKILPMKVSSKLDISWCKAISKKIEVGTRCFSANSPDAVVGANDKDMQKVGGLLFYEEKVVTRSSTSGIKFNSTDKHNLSSIKKQFIQAEKYLNRLLTAVASGYCH